jgi:hypothetical protein
MTRRVAVLVGVLLGVGAASAAAQNSVYGIRGLGFPGRGVNTRGRALGSGLLALDAGSVGNPAAVSSYGSVSVEIMGETNLRDYTIDTTRVTGLSDTRFPLAQLGGRIGRSPFAFGISYSQYTERSYDITNSDTILLRGQAIGFDERTTSRGGISDLRGALGYRLGTAFRIGAALHLLTGSAKLTFLREFSDSSYRPYRIESEEKVSGYGVSVGASWAPAARLVLGLALRSDSRAHISVDSVDEGYVDLPVSVIGGAQLSATRTVRWSASVAWRSWGSADADILGHAFDTWEVGTGIEVGGPETGVSKFPLRIGARYATLPFGPTTEQPHELDLALGLGAAFASNRGLADLAIERVYRRGAGADETAWQLSWTVSVRP